MASEYLFAYGTLMPGHTPDNIAGAVEKLLYVGSGAAQGKLYDLGEYAGAVLDTASPMKILGCVFALPQDEDALKFLDAYEGLDPQDSKNSLFSRELTTVILDDGRELRCWIYVYNQDVGSAKLISSGDYWKYLAA